MLRFGALDADRIVSLDDPPEIVAIVELPAVSLDDHTAHDPLSAEIDANMSPVAVGALGVVEAHPRHPDGEAARAQGDEPANHPARPYPPSAILPAVRYPLSAIRHKILVWLLGRCRRMNCR
jgi:hypothetical protein